MAHASRNLFLEGPAGRLEAVLWTPLSQQTPPVAAVLCHPHPLFGGTMHNKVVYQAAKSLDSLGLPVLRFNFRGAGLSGGVHDRGIGELADVQAAIDYVAETFPGVPLLVGGFSFGAWVSLRVGCEDRRVQALLAMGTPVDNSDFSYLSGCAKPKLFVHGSRDEHGALKKLKDLIAGLPGENHLAVVEGAEHFFVGQLDRVDQAIIDWLAERFPHITGFRRG